MTDTIRFEQNEGIARLGFNNSARHNALGREQLAAIEAALDRIDESTRVLVIASEGGRTFCAGADLSQMASGELSGDQFQAVTNRIAELPIPTLCVLNGNVFGGGVELAVSCDFRICADDIVLRIPAAAIGLCYPIDGIERLVARLGVSTAKRLLVAAEELTARQMKSLGIVSRVTSSAEIMAAATEWAREIAELAPLSVRSMLEIIGQAERGGIDRVIAAQLSERCSGSDDLKEGLSAKRERRAPQFRGR